jgi:putative acetyltransferase
MGRMTEILVRGFVMDDWEQVAELFMGKVCIWGTLQMPYQSKDAIKTKLENPPKGMHRLVAVTVDSQRVLGLLGLAPGKGRRAHAGSIGMFVHDEYQDQGIGTQLMEAAIQLSDNWLNLRRLELEVFVDNPRAVHLYEKFGFVKEGTLVDFAYRDGKYVDTLAMARIRK